jgi:CheY-like chemotaxis protein
LSAEEAEAQGRLVLVVDDDRTNRTVLLRQVTMCGATALVAVNGREALNIWCQRRIALVLTDCHMPELDGYGLAEAIRQEEKSRGLPRVPIVAATGGAFADELQRCRAVGMDDALAKPVRLEEVRRVLATWLPKASPLVSTSPAPSPSSSSSLPSSNGVSIYDERLENKVAPALSVSWSCLPALDRSYLVELFGEDPDLLAQVLEDFLAAAGSLLHALRTSAAAFAPTIPVTEEQEAQLVLVRQAAHKLAGSARTVGAAQLGQVAAMLEETLLTRPPSLFPARLPELLSGINDAWATLRATIAEDYR